MKWMIRYTSDEKKFEEYEEQSIEFTKEVREELAKILTDEYICNKQYPVGSVYMNYKDATNPNILLGCGEWKLVPRDLYLRSADADGSTNFRDNLQVELGKYSWQTCLPNISGNAYAIAESFNNNGWADGAFSKYGGYGTNPTPDKFYNWNDGGRLEINAHSSDVTYTDNCRYNIINSDNIYYGGSDNNKKNGRNLNLSYIQPAFQSVAVWKRVE